MTGPPASLSVLTVFCAPKPEIMGMVQVHGSLNIFTAGPEGLLCTYNTYSL